MEIRKGVIKGFDAGSYTATVQVAGSLSVWLEGVPVSGAIPSGEMVAGRTCAVLFFDPSSPKDGVVLGVWR
jgi:hypothetical protein